MENLLFVGQGNTCQAIKLFIDYKILYIVTTLFFPYRNRFYIVLPWSKVFINILKLHMIHIDLYLALYLS